MTSLPRHLVLMLVLVASTAPGCATLENAEAARDAKNAPPGERTPTAVELGLAADGKIDEEMIVRAALEAHPAVTQARQRVDTARARVGQAQAAFWPQVGTGADWRFTTRNPDGNNEHDFDTYGSWSFGFNVSWLIFDFGRTPALARAAAEEYLAAQTDFRTAEVQVAFAAREAYFELEKQIELLVVAVETVRQFEKRLELVVELVKVGARIPLDQTRAEVDLGNARLAEVRTRDQVRISQARLASAIGLAELTDWAPERRPPLTGVPPTFGEAWDIARESQPAIASARSRERAAEEVLTAQIAALWPRLSFGFGASGGANDFPLPWNFSFGPSLDWTIFDGFANLRAIDSAAASLRSARASRASIEQTVWLDVRTAYVSIENARVRLDLTELIVRSAEQNLELAAGRYEVGAGTSVDLSDAQQLLAQARADRVQARADHDTAVSRLWRALGSTVIGGAP